MVYASIKLVNNEDLVLSKRHLLGEEDIKQMSVRMLVDSGSYYLGINERIQEYLQLDPIGIEPAIMADGSRIQCMVVGPVRVEFEGCIANCNALVLPGDSEPLLGAIPMEDMNVVILPTELRLAPNPEGRRVKWHF